MKKVVITLESLQSSMGAMTVSIQKSFDKISESLDRMQENAKDVQKNVEFLVVNAVMRDEVRQIVREEIAPVESRLLAAMDVIIGKHQIMEGEVLGHDYRIGKLESTVGFGTVA
ncbi:MAG: hypothetical protein NTX72_03940 [Candidatus Uhrbacteria bacterium]|nr:hypothetical protein [Candidatus Uhrbacteria bacterium]